METKSANASTKAELMEKMDDLSAKFDTINQTGRTFRESRKLVKEVSYIAKQIREPTSVSVSTLGQQTLENCIDGGGSDSTRRKSSGC